MTSQINYSSIDETYPIAGQDNNSQGFRDNFTYIKDGLAVAKSEITDLQSNTAKLNESNDFNGILLANAVTSRFFGSVYNLGNISTNQNISLNQGEYQIANLTTSASFSFTFRDWPDSDQYARIRLQLTGDTSQVYTVTFSTQGGGVIKYVNGFPSPYQLSIAGETKIVEAWTYNGGSLVFMSYLGSWT